MDAIERLSTIEDLRRLMARYVRYADHKRWQDLAGLFTPDGTFTPHKPDGSVWLSMRGRTEIAATIGSSAGPRDALVHHLFSDEIDVESATSASGVWSMEDLITRAESADGQVEAPEDFPFRSMHGFGHYHGRFTKRDGAWYIAELRQTRLRLDFTY
ncbi:nuclear transport factor 2 family protein [Streptomyces chromofuscus]|uniref:Nuclear transport factor 2 family protein n=1 Tax=Streptomyces chromofuscus TaxID=42881 RepID=A0A7M2T4D1_STRCW|nr:nuclear transport factor 2 family protein [Streptomyces chromofuscus]QOV43520.1 nuclear transport factor 2 family protein [Streptomyces chromofuscus]GGT10182.1 hypothetical protein GCM10010254_33470 [Streptomyces chromofuscus]